MYIFHQSGGGGKTKKISISSLFGFQLSVPHSTAFRTFHIRSTLTFTQMGQSPVNTILC